ncbi:isopentenyl-diphosphate Delta-isomerase [Nocardia iowensis]|uniref:Isopentenyl-diphosphate Delta-isomerase n=1 Tax=Nocardia iowensis TaxID=204891 RepID=A0ABX8RW60_NOCIO|nr:isopentenyl-diphosphate Delta-isomerase [Nocardia iowensis]QXN93892.1 isopentenyl-diphosphate Delta-isomerase [Nocardia iowensis]
MTDTLAQPITDREALPVELVDDEGNAIGTCPVSQAHQSPGQLHRAFSVLLFDNAGRVLLQQRAAVKTRFPSQWANTCCGHPAPGEPVVAAATVRLAEEMGLATTLTEVGVYRYHAEDAATGRVEFEWDHVLVGLLAAGSPRPDPAEVAAYVWIQPDALRDALTDDPDAYTPWLVGVLDVAEQALTGRSPR